MRPIIEAHRGDSVNAPENTLAAFRRAVELRVPSIELDVHPTADNVLVVMHDDTVRRTTNGTGAIRDMTLADIRTLDAGTWFSAEYAGEPVPTLAEVIELLRPTQTRLNIEVKASPAGADVPATVVRLLRDAGMQRDSVVSSFDLQALLAVRAIAPEITLALIGDGGKILEAALRHRLPWIHAHYPTATHDIVARAHAAGIRVNIWTLDDPAAVDRWRRRDVDKICTNNPSALLAAVRDLDRG